ncbi:MAG: diacylglycerol kinase [Gammaproteobacteria bacterium]|nr:diacylglycerol kinase [Gammaproteobacteria bacterium]
MDNTKGIPRLVRAMKATLAGLKWAAKNEEAVQLELFGLLFFIPLGLWLGDNGVERALLVGSVFLVLLVEIINTGIEAAIDRIGPERHELSGVAKDLGSAAVFIALVMAAITWALLLL